MQQTAGISEAVLLAVSCQGSLCYIRDCLHLPQINQCESAVLCLAGDRSDRQCRRDGWSCGLGIPACLWASCLRPDFQQSTGECPVRTHILSSRSCVSKGVCPYIPLTVFMPSCVTKQGCVGPDQSSQALSSILCIFFLCSGYLCREDGERSCAFQGFPSCRALMQLGQ